jgi:hypothetical protein
VESIHHHDDGQDHDDCPVCVAALHHSADTAFPSPVLLSVPQVSATFFQPFIPKTFTTRLLLAPRDRAPPT